MLRNFDLSVWPPNNAGAIARLCVGVLLLANLVAAYFVIWPVGGSAQDLRNQASQLRVQLGQKRLMLERTRLLASKIETGRSEGETFLGKYFLPRRTASFIIVSELDEAAAKAKIKGKERSYSFEPIEGTDVFSMMQVTANFEGTYADLINFINLLDKSDKLIVIESLGATPQQGSDLLNVQFKLDAFVREDAGA